MSQQALDLRRSIQIVRRHKLLMGIMVALGLLAGGAYAVLHPPMVTSTALVLLPQSGQAAANGAAAAANGGPDPYTATQEVIAKSNPVLLAALPNVRPVMSINQLRSEVAIGSLTPYIISVSAEGKIAADAAATANAVAKSYINYVGSASSPGGQIPAQLLQSATSATGSGGLKQLVIYALLGAIFGALIGVIIALAISRSDRRLRERDEIANSIGVPVLASFPVDHPTDARGWTKLLEDYKPGALHALQLRRALQQLEMAAAAADVSMVVRMAGGHSLSCLFPPILEPSLSVPSWRSLPPPKGSPLPSSSALSKMRRSRPRCEPPAPPPPASSKRPGHLQVLVSDSDVEVQPDAVLTVVVAVVDSRSPQVPDTMRTTATVLGVSAGAATADQLARVAVSAASSGREITGILVADPDSADATTGRLPQLGRRGQRRMPTRMTGIATEIRR